MGKEVVTNQEEKLPAEVRANMLSGEKSIFFNVALFEQTQRVAHMFASSTMVPIQFRNNIGNCMIALNYAFRLQADPFMVMQTMYEVHGRPGIEGKLVEAIINQSGKYSEPLQYIWLDPADNEVKRSEVLRAQVPSDYGCQAYTIDQKSGKRVDGPKITWALIKAEGWHDKPGADGKVTSNKWRTMPEMMFYYRAASWFANKNCPELKLGMHTVEELEEIVELRPSRNGAYGIPSDSATALNEKIKASADRPTKEDIYKPRTEAEPQKPQTTSTLSTQEQEIYNSFIHIRKQATLKATAEILKKEMPSWSPQLRKEWEDKWLRIMKEPYKWDLGSEKPPTTESLTEDEEVAESEEEQPGAFRKGSLPWADRVDNFVKIMQAYEDKLGQDVYANILLAHEVDPPQLKDVTEGKAMKLYADMEKAYQDTLETEEE